MKRNIKLQLMFSIAQNIIKSQTVLAITFGCSMLTIIICAFKGVDNQHVAIYLLPIIVLLGAFFLQRKNLFINAGILLLFFSYVFRFTFVVIFIVLGDYRTDIPVNIVIPYFNIACILMCYEFICILIAIFVMSKIFTKKSDKSCYLKTICKKESVFCSLNNSILYYFIIILFIFCLVSLLFYPILIYNFKFFLSNITQELNSLENYILAQKLVPGFVFYPFVMSVESLRVLIPLLIVVKICNDKNSEFAKIIFTSLICIVSILFTTHVQITGIFVSFISMLYLVNNLKKYKNVVGILFIVLGAILLFYSVANYSSANNFSMLSRVFQNYFNGPSCIAGALGLDNSKGIEYFFSDMLSSNSVINGIFNYTKKSFDFHLDYIMDTTRSSIFPYLAQSKYYFGYLLSPTLTVIATIIICYIDKINMYNKNKTSEVLLFYISFMLVIGISMYSATSLYDVIFEKFVPLWSVYFIANNISHYKRGGCK